MDRNIPFNFVCILINWYSKMDTVVSWGEAISPPVWLSARVRQGSVLSPSLFFVFVSSALCKLSKSGLGCHRLLKVYVNTPSLIHAIRNKKATSNSWDFVYNSIFM